MLAHNYWTWWYLRVNWYKEVCDGLGQKQHNMLETWKELSACTSSSHHSLRWKSVLLVLYALLAYTQALPLVHTAQKRSATPFEGVYNCNSSSSIGKCTHRSFHCTMCRAWFLLLPCSPLFFLAASICECVIYDVFEVLLKQCSFGVHQVEC